MEIDEQANTSEQDPVEEGANPTPVEKSDQQIPAESNDQQQERYAHMAAVQARTERELRQLQQKLREQTEVASSQQAAADEYASLKQAIQSGDYSVLEKLGATYDGWTDAQLSRPSEQDQALQQLRNELDELKQERQARQEQEATRTQQESLQAQRDYVRDEIVGKAEGEALGLVAALQGYDSVLSEYHAEHKRTGIVPDENAVATRVEQRLAEDLRNEMKALLGVKKFRDILSGLQQEMQQTQQADQGRTSSAGKSIPTADLAQNAGGRTTTELSDAEASARALARVEQAISSRQ